MDNNCTHLTSSSKAPSTVVSGAAISWRSFSEARALDERTDRENLRASVETQVRRRDASVKRE